MNTVKQLASSHGITYRGIADRSDGSGSALLFVYDMDQYANYFTTGYFPTLRQAAEFTKALFESHDTEEILMNIFKNDKLFPNIRGVMLKEKRVTLTMSGKVKVVEMRDGQDVRVEIFFSDHPKSAVINRTQTMDIADVYGPETDNWAGCPVVLYGEHGTWFGKETWGVRVDKGATERAKTQMRKNGQSKPQPEPEPEPPTELFPPEENGAYNGYEVEEQPA